jgi:UDP-2-acetamido-3-amino-2,3-dideoxy-glucuronate N-acetyltransferase
VSGGGGLQRGRERGGAGGARSGSIAVQERVTGTRTGGASEREGANGNGGGVAELRAARVHPTAMVEEGVEIGAGTSVWDHVHIRGPARIGAECIIGGKSYVAYGVVIGDRVKINANVYLCTGVTIEDGVMISAGTVFTNDRFPRATTPDLARLRESGPDEHTRPTKVCTGATIGAGAIIGCDLAIGSWAMIGMGSVVTRSVPAFHLAVGNPARSIGLVCRCGEPTARFAAGSRPPPGDVECAVCGRRYRVRSGGVEELAPAEEEAR